MENDPELQSLSTIVVFSRSSSHCMLQPGSLQLNRNVYPVAFDTILSGVFKITDGGVKSEIGNI